MLFLLLSLFKNLLALIGGAVVLYQTEQLLIRRYRKQSRKYHNHRLQKLEHELNREGFKEDAIEIWLCLLRETPTMSDLAEMKLYLMVRNGGHEREMIEVYTLLTERYPQNGGY